MQSFFFMFRFFFLSFFLLGMGLSISAQTQNKAPQDFGFRYLQMPYQADPVNILVLSQKGHEQKKKPVFLYIQGSLPIPLIIYDEQGRYNTFPFRTQELLQHFHLVIVGKPYIPVVVKAQELPSNLSYVDPETGKFPVEYSERNILDYYVNRNLEVIKFLKKQSWVDNRQFVVAGHSEGSTIASKMAVESRDISHLIYSSGNPLGRIMTFLAISRASEDAQAESDLLFWQYIVKNAESLDGSEGDTPKATYQFSDPPLHNLEQLSIPVMVTYGTRDFSAIFNDYLRVETTRDKKLNFTYKAYSGLEHNYFGITPEGEIDYNAYHWDKVARDWLDWLLKP